MLGDLLTGGPNAVLSETPDLPETLVGVQDEKSKTRGNRHISGPLDPAFGGTGIPSADFDKLTGGKSAPADSRYPSGTMIGENGVSIRPGNTGGWRIDIPARGGRPHETLHYD
jgi:hypothetical protein